MKKELTVIIYTENNIGLLNKVTTMFSRRRINIESLNVAASEVEGIHRFTIVIHETEEAIKKLMSQIEKQVDVFKSFYHTNEEIVWQEQILYKVPANAITNGALVNALKNYAARLISSDKYYTVYEITGPAETTDAAIKELTLMGITEIVKSARIAIIKTGDAFYQKLNQLELLQKKSEDYNN